MVVVANLASVAAGREPLRPRRALCGGALLAGHLLAFGPYTLLLGFLGLGRVYPGPISLAAAAIVAGVIGLGWLRGGAVTRRRLVGVGLLLLALDGMTAVGRASVFAFYHEPVLTPALAPRYQYLPLAFLALMLCIALASLRSASRAAGRTVYAAAVVWVLARTVVLLLRPLPIDHHDWERAETERDAHRPRGGHQRAGRNDRPDREPDLPAVAVHPALHAWPPPGLGRNLRRVLA
jgi:hypothetical protein